MTKTTCFIGVLIVAILAIMFDIALFTVPMDIIGYIACILSSNALFALCGVIIWDCRAN